MLLTSCESGEAEGTSGVRSFNPRYSVLRSIMIGPYLIRTGRVLIPSFHRPCRPAALSQILVELETDFCIVLRLPPKCLRVLRLALGQHLEARFHQQEILYALCGCA